MNGKSARKFLGIEDNLGDARLLREMLNEEGAHVIEFTHASLPK
jgi:hypothetical protein